MLETFVADMNVLTYNNQASLDSLHTVIANIMQMVRNSQNLYQGKDEKTIFLAAFDSVLKFNVPGMTPEQLFHAKRLRALAYTASLSQFIADGFLIP